MSGGLSLRSALINSFYSWRLVVACLTLGLLVGFEGALFTPPVYTAESLLIPEPASLEPSQQKVGAATPAEAPDAAARTVKSDARILTSEPVLRAAVQSLPGGGDLSTTRRVDRMRKHLDVSTQPDSNVIRVAFSDPDRDRAIRTVDALVRSYAQVRAAAYAGDAAGAQQRQVTSYADQLASLEGRIRDTQAQAGVLDLPQDVQIAGRRLDEATDRAQRAHEELSGVSAELAQAGGELARMPGQVLDSAETSTAKSNDDSRNTLGKLQLERQHVLQQYTAAWPGLRDLDARIATAQAQAAAADKSQSRTERQIRNPLLNQVQGKAADLRIQRASLSGQVGQLDAEVSAARGRVDQLRDVQQRLQDLQRQRDIVENLYRQLSVNTAGVRLHDMELDRSGGVRVLQPATAPGAPVDRAPLIALAGLLLGLAGAVVAVTLAALLRRSFITPDEAASALDLPLLAVVPEDAGPLDDAQALEALRPLARRVAEATVDGRPLRSLRIVGTAAGAHTDAELAEAVGKLLAPSAEHGVVLVGPASSGGAPAAAPALEPDRLRATGTPHLWALSPAVLRRLREAGTPQVAAFVALLSRRFDQVLVPGPADAAQQPPDALFRLTDANLLVVVEGVTRAPAVKRLRETILASGGDLLGVVYLGRRLHIPERIYRWL